MSSFVLLAQVVSGGLVMGGLYAMVAMGLSLIYGVTRVLNFAHGTFVALAGIAGSILFSSLGIHPAWSILLAAAVFFVLGFGFYDLLLKPVMKYDHFKMTIGTVLITIGAFMIIEDLASVAAGPVQRNILLPSTVIAATGGIVTSIQLYVLLGITAVTLALHAFLKHSWFGRAIRALTQDQFAATAFGVQSELIRGATFAVGTAMAGVSGVLYAMTLPVDLHTGFILTVKAFTVIAIGGIGNLTGTLVASVLLGVTEALVAFYVSSEWAPAVSIVVLLVVLVLAPRTDFVTHR